MNLEEKDLFKSGFFESYPRISKAYIVGSAPNINGDYDFNLASNPAVITIYLNKAIKLKPRHRLGIWLCADAKIREQTWFIERMSVSSQGIKIFSRELSELFDNKFCDFHFFP